MRNVRVRAVALAAVLSLAAAGVAQADPGRWGGFNVGLGVGGAWSDSDLDLDFERIAGNGPNFFEDQRSASDDDESAFGFVRLGYDHQVGVNFVIGVFVDHEFKGENSVDFSANDLALNQASTFSTSASFEYSDATNIGGRVGYLVNPKTLIFASGGYSRIDVQGSATMVNVAGGTVVAVNVDDELDGYFVGGGAEYQLHPGLALTFEYRYAEYDGETYTASVGVPGTAGFRQVSADVDAEIHSARVGLSWKLGQP